MTTPLYRQMQAHLRQRMAELRQDSTTTSDDARQDADDIAAINALFARKD